MKKREKYLLALLTMLFLFAVLRTCSSEKDKVAVHKEKQRPLISPTYKSVEEEAESTLKVSDQLKEVGAHLKAKDETPLQSFVAKKENLSNTSKEEDLFKTKSPYVYFKIQKRLALVGGDMVMGELKEEQSEKDFHAKLFKDEPPQSKLWSSNKIPFGFAPDFPEELKARVTLALDYFNSETVMNFYTAEEGVDEDVIVFQFREGVPCSSYLGRIGGYQPIYLNFECKEQDILHETLHALGFVHEQQREGRTQVLQILWDNIKPEYLYNFSLLPDSMVHPYVGAVFDVSLTSIMMYHDEAFALKGKKSMRSLRGEEIAPISKGLNKIDKERLEYLYGG